MAPTVDSALAKRLRREVRGDVLFDDASRARYATDASIYQIMPLGVVCPRDADDVQRVVDIARDAGASITPRGGGTSQGGQCIGTGIILDDSRYMHRMLDLEPEQRRCTVEPGMVLDDLNRALAPHGLTFPVDISTANRATIGGMTGNNSAGTRSIRYGLMADNVHAVEALLADGTRTRFAPDQGGRYAAEMMSVFLSVEEELKRHVPQVMRHVAGYNLHRLAAAAPNPAEVLVGSEGTLGVFTAVELELSHVLPHRVLGVAHFDTLRQAMEATQYIVELEPTAVELVDRKLIDLAQQIPELAPLVDGFMRGQPDAMLFVEFAGDNPAQLQHDLTQLDELLRDRDLSKTVVHAQTAAEQSRIWAVRKAGLNIVMSMKGDTKPVSFIEDCTVPLNRLAEYHDRLNDVFARNGTTGTWYAHASVGCLHVRPALNLKTDAGAAAMRAIATEAHEVVREFKGSVSGEHGDGIVRSEFIEPQLGSAISNAFARLKSVFDPDNVLNPGKIVDPPRMDDRRLFRYGPSYQSAVTKPELDWSDWSGLLGAVEMCNNNGACRKTFDGSMCPSYRATRDEIDSTRGRANTLRMAMTGQLGRDALADDAVKEAMDLCVGCKACRRECPTGVDMARMKIETLAARREQYGTGLRDLAIAHLPRMAPWLSRFSGLVNAAGAHQPLRQLMERMAGISADRALPTWAARPFASTEEPGGPDGPVVALFADTFDRYFEPGNLHAAVRVLTASGYRVVFPAPDSGRPLCCGRTYLNAGLVNEARDEAQRSLAALRPLAQRGIPIVGLEPSCMLTFRDEIPALFPGQATDVAHATFLFEEFVSQEKQAGRWDVNYKPGGGTALVHGHCHQKAFGLERGMSELLEDVPDLTIEMIESSCCGMAGSFGYEAEHLDVSRQMAELSLAPAVRDASAETVILADGVSCRHQIADVTGRPARHVARFLADRLA